ncbi:serine/threonine-protein kinase [Streptomyces sp. ICBB 8177]|uniref:serine/threonine-protein kinase n=1 Tax=Streptomyces sp. ICBB 8177 TaxID=563922 RepID=UPI000D681897|nr:serine/threonine-protein kinase [Streptomyces sp. ICBB 8177]PWI42047.1 serine/threonine protein kinase [Streptomyces sp. ICBB 8177]
MTMMRLRREDPRVVGSFRLHRRLGAGGMGVVYLGSDKRGQRVALKVIRPELAEDQEFRQRFAREVSAARRIRGGCTARLVAADLETERPWFATQYVPGPSLYDKVGAEGPLPAAEVAGIGAALAEGLVAVHDAGVVHRDLKPSNILLSPKGPRIIDFGIAWATGASTLTHVGTAVGSPGFLAPEQVRGAAVTPATDVFAFGATLAYAAAADSPFGQGSSEVMLYRVVHEEPDLRGVPDALAPLVYACLAKEPGDRPSAARLAERLSEIAAREARGLDSGAPRKAAGPHPERPTGPRAEEYARQRTERRPAEAGHEASSVRTPPRGHPARTPAGRAPGRPPAQRGAPARTPAPRTPAGRRPGRPDRRLLRQRVIVFVTVTLLVALGIAAAQGCQGPSHGLGVPHAPVSTASPTGGATASGAPAAGAVSGAASGAARAPEGGAAAKAPGGAAVGTPTVSETAANAPDDGTVDAAAGPSDAP